MIEEHRPSVYVHVPFCRRRCPYCAFVSAVPEKDDPDQYLEALSREMEVRAEGIPADGAWSILIGGGTPTLPGPEWLASLLALVRKSAYGPATREWSIESLPGCITPEVADVLRIAGVDRVTLGMQSMDPVVLNSIGRADQLPALWKAVEILRNAGIRSIGIDLILGLPGEKIVNFRAGLEELIAAKIPHISAYMLSIEEGTPWGLQKIRVSDWMQRRLFTILARQLMSGGYEQYEVSNYALPGFACRHNQGTWEGRELLGFGLAAVGTVSSPGGARVRRQNTGLIEAYLADPVGGYDEEWLTPTDRYHEALMLGLRSCSGLPEDCGFAEETGFSPGELRSRLEEFESRGLLCRHAGRWRTTFKGRLWLDSILVDLFLG